MLARNVNPSSTVSCCSSSFPSSCCCWRCHCCRCLWGLRGITSSSALPAASGLFLLLMLLLLLAFFGRRSTFRRRLLATGFVHIKAVRKTAATTAASISSADTTTTRCTIAAAAATRAELKPVPAQSRQRLPLPIVGVRGESAAPSRAAHNKPTPHICYQSSKEHAYEYPGQDLCKPHNKCLSGGAANRNALGSVERMGVGRTADFVYVVY